MVGQILSESWKLGDMLTKVIENHHTPPADDPFCQLITLADFAGGYIYPYPKDSEYPMAKILREEGMQADAEPPEAMATTSPAADRGEEGEQSNDAEPGSASGLTPGAAVYNFLPPHLLQRLDIDINKLITAARHIKPTVERLTEEIRKSA
jgi:hypothetical protein